MTASVALLTLLTLLFAAWITAHVALLFRMIGVTGITSRERWISLLIPVFAPWPAWRAGLRRHVVLWACLIVAYAAARLVLALR